MEKPKKGSSKQNMCNVFKNLEFSNTDYTEIKKHFMTFEKGLKRQDWLSKSFFPEDSVLGQLAEATYHDDISSLPSGWELLTTVRNKKDGYFGAAYFNINENQTVIAHRGTKLSNLNAVLTDLEGIIYNKFTSQMESACTFVASLLLELNLESSSLSITGHSLGGWLAQITAFSSEYLTMNENGFHKKSDQGIKFHAHTVVFDSPGCREMLVQLSENYYPRYLHKSHYIIDSLDITVFLSAPNLINTCNRHVGTLYRIYPTLPVWGLNWENFLKKWTEKSHEAIQYTLQNHNLKGILSALTGRKQEVLDWPLVTWPPGIDKKVVLNDSWLIKAIKLIKATPILTFDKIFNLRNHEYKKFFEFANKVNSYNPKEKMKLGDILLHYEVIEPRENDCSITIFSQDELVFLESWLLFKDINSRELYGFLSENNLGKYINVLNSFSIVPTKYGDKRISCKPEMLKSVVNCIKQLFLHYSTDIKKVMNQMAGIPEVFEALFKTKTKDYLLFNKLSLEFEDSIWLQNFLESVEHNVLYIRSNNSTLEVTRIYSALMNIGSAELKKFTDEKYFSFFSWPQILSLENIIGFSKVINSQLNLIVLDCQEVEMSVEDIHLLNTLLKSLNNSCKKSILIANENDSIIKRSVLNNNYVEHRSKLLVWGDLTVDTQKNLLMKDLVLFQNENKKINLKEAIGIDVQNKEKLKNLKKVIKSETIVKLINNEDISLGNAPVYSCSLDNSCTHFYEEIPPQNVLNFLLEVLHDSSHPVLILSGLDQEAAKQNIINILGIHNMDDKKKQNQLMEQIDYIHSCKEYRNKRILICSNEFNNNNFHNFCRYNPKITVYWIKFKDQKLILQQLYDPNLYISRHFQYFSKLVVCDYLKYELLKADFNNKYIFSNTNQNSLVEMLGGFSDYEKNFLYNKVQNSEILFFGGEEEAQNYFTKLRCDVSAHWIHVEKSKLVWKCSQGSLKPISRSIDFVESEEKLTSEEDFFKEVKGNKTVIIVGDPGMGKSTALLKFSEIMQPSCWVVQINLKHCSSAIETLPSHDMTINDVVNFVHKFDDKGDRSLEKNIIRYKIEHGSNNKPLFLLFDGFDEIKNKKEKRKIIMLFKFIKDKVSMWITSRKHDKNELENTLSVFTTHLIELTPEEQKKYLRQFWNGQFLLSWDINKITECFPTSDRKEAITKFDIFTNALFIALNKIYGENFVRIPLQLRLIAEGFKNKFSKFISDGHSEPDFSTLRICKLYNYFVDAKFDIYLKEKLILTLVNSVSEKWFKEPVRKRHLRLSFIKLFGDHCKDLVGQKPPINSIENFCSFTIDQEDLEELLCVGFIHIDENNSFDFLHQTISEYFAAEYLIHLLKKPLGNPRSLSALGFLLTVILKNPEYNLIHLILNDFLKDCLEKFSNETLKLYGEEIKRLWVENHQQFINDDNQTCLHVISKNNYYNILIFILSTLGTSSVLEECTDFISLRNLNGETALYEAIKHHHNNIVHFFFGLIEESFNRLVIETVLLATAFKTVVDQNNHNTFIFLPQHLSPYPKINSTLQHFLKTWPQTSFFQGVMEGNIHNIELILKDAGLKLNKYLLLMVDSDGNSVLHITAMKSKWNVFEFLVKKLSDEDLFYLFRTKNDADQTVMHIITKKTNINLNFILTVLSEIINRIPEKYRSSVIGTKNYDGMTILHLAAEDGKWDIVKDFVKSLHKDHQSEVINIKNNHGWGIIHLAAQKADLDTFKELVEKGADILQLTKSSVLHETVCNDDKEVLKFVLRKLSERLNGNSKQLYHYVNAKDSQGDTPLMWAAERGNIIAVKELLGVKQLDVWVQNSVGKTALDWAYEKQNKEIVEILQTYIETKKGV